MGGVIIDYVGDVITPTVYITTSKVIVDSTTRGTMHVLQHKKLLLGNTFYLILIHQNSYRYPTRGDH